MRSYLARVRLIVAGGDGAAVSTREVALLDMLSRELPTVRVEPATACGVCDPIVDDETWAAAADLSELDAAVRCSPSDAVSIRGRPERLALVACQVLGRYQCFVDRRSPCSMGPSFDAVLRGHRGVHGAGDDAAIERSLDRWQWLLRIAPRAPFPAQVAALFRDVPHALEHVLAAAGIEEPVALRALRLSRDGDPDVEDAEGLSFLSLDSERAGRREVVSVAAGLTARAREKLRLIHVTPDVQQWLAESVVAA